MRTLLIILITVCFVIVSFAQRPNLKFDHFNTKNGLIKNFVSKILQDDKGIMWFGSENGLNKFDGYNFSLFQNTLQPNSLGSNDIRAIYEDKQKNLWIGTTTGLHLYDRENNNFIRFETFRKVVQAIFEDRFNTLWVTTNKGEVYILDRVSRKFHPYWIPVTNYAVESGTFFNLFEDSEGTLWYVNEGEMKIIDRLNKKLVKAGVGGTGITGIFEDHSKNLWFSSRGGGLILFDRQSKKYRRYLHDPENPNSLSDNVVFCITEDINGRLWIGTDHGGLDILDADRKSFHNYHPNPSDDESISSQSIYSFYQDKSNNIWVGTYNGGVNLAKTQHFGHYKNTGGDGTGLNHNNIVSFCEDRRANIWVSTDGGGLNRYDSKKGQFSYYVNDPKNPKSIANNFVTNVTEDRAGYIWAGLWNGGLDRFDPETNEFKHYRHDPKKPASIVSDNVWKIFEDSDLNLWIGTYYGLDMLNRVTGNFTHYNQDNSGLSNNSILYIFEDSDHDLWVATSSGLNLLNREAHTFTSFLNHEGDPKSISDNGIMSLFQDSKGRLWVCTRNGLNLYNKSTRTFTKYSEKDGLPSNSMCAMLEDRKGNLWISTQNGISVFNPDTKRIQNYDSNDGLQDNEFKQLAALKTSSGEMLFGGNNGFNMFDPDSIVSNTFIPPVIITDLKIFNRSVKNSDLNSVLINDISETKKITLSYDQSVFSFEFAALNYVAREKNRYSYKMEGFDDDWNFIGNARTATYTNLDPGEYTFRVKASNNDGIWNEEGTSIKVVITPPYWRTWWFRTFLGLIILTGVYTFLKVRVNVIKEQKAKLEVQVRQQTEEVVKQRDALEAQTEDLQTLHESQQAQTEYLQVLNVELQQQKEEIRAKGEEAENARQEAVRANQAKSIFLATMSHEIRTPMNGVLGMASLLSETALTSEQREYADTIRSSGDALLTVINDILDFSKIESGNLELDNHAFDLRQCIEDVMDIFSTKAAQKGLDLIYEIDYQIPAQIVGDSHRLRQILLNLISNAMKFTNQGEIFVRVNLLNTVNNELELAFQIRDTGIGISKDKLSRLFKSFSQVDSSTTRKYGGTGLGLAISERLVGLMSGTISVESVPDSGTSFMFTIKSLMNQESIREYVHYNTLGNEGKKVLLVDDNATNRTILKNSLILWKLDPTLASSGKEALEVLAGPEKFDLVITDMQMPDMDGLGLAQAIKATLPSMPVILLSSVGDESRNKYPELFTSVLNKPVRQQQLNLNIHRALRPETGTSPIDDRMANTTMSEEFAKMHPLRILLAEDNPVNQRLTVRVLSKLGYHKVEIAQNGLDAIEKFNEQFYDVILMDVQMPEMDGLEATRLIRSKQYHQPIIIAMTANVMAEDKEACRLAGMDDYISKPIKLEIFVSLLEKSSLYLKEKSEARVKFV